MNKLMALLSLAIMIGFLGILAYKVPSIDLVIVVAFTLVLAAYDVITSAFGKKD